MPSDETNQATIENDIQGQLVVSNFVLQIVGENGGIVNVRTRTEDPGYTRRRGPLNLRPRPFLALLDREEELATLKSAIQASKPVSLFGPAGTGKTSLLRSLAHLPETGQFPDGVVYLSVSTLGLEDILQALFDVFYESQVNFKPVESEIRSALLGIKALVLLDDLTLNRDEAQTLLGAAPDCTFVFASPEQSLWEEAEIIPLKGLPGVEALDLFVLELNHSLNDQEQAEVREICEKVAGYPLHILQSASLVREKTATIDEVKTRLQHDTPENMVLRTLQDSSAVSQKNVISILAAAGGAMVPVKHLQALSQSADLKSDLQVLVALGLVQTHDSKFSLAGDLSAALATLWDGTSWEDRLIEYLADWLTKEPAEDSLDDSVDLLVKTVQKADEKGRWQDVIRIGRGLERALIFSRHWQAWMDLLNLMLKAARALNDRKVEAWALHQIGTRAACLNLDEPARGFLMEALKIRRSIGDKAGLAVTQHNLQVFFNILQSPKAGQFRSRRCLTCGAIGASLFAIASIMVAGLFLFFSNQAPLQPLPQTLSITETLSLTDLPPGTVSQPGTETPLVTFTPSPMPTPAVLFDFVSNANRAVWESSETFDPDDNVFEDCDLTFGASPTPSCGFARWESAALEDNSTLQNVLVVEPYHTNGGQIWGTYDLTDLTITEGSQLVTVVGFLKDAETLGVAFQVSFTTGDPDFSPVLVYATRDRKDGQLIAAITPLPDDLIGQRGYFIFQVLAAPNTDANWASWAVARLEQP